MTLKFVKTAKKIKPKPPLIKVEPQTLTLDKTAFLGGVESTIGITPVLPEGHMSGDVLTYDGSGWKAQSPPPAVSLSSAGALLPLEYVANNVANLIVEDLWGVTKKISVASFIEHHPAFETLKDPYGKINAQMTKPAGGPMAHALSVLKDHGVLVSKVEQNSSVGLSSYSHSEVTLTLTLTGDSAPSMLYDLQNWCVSQGSKF